MKKSTYQSSKGADCERCAEFRKEGFNYCAKCGKQLRKELVSFEKLKAKYGYSAEEK